MPSRVRFDFGNLAVASLIRGEKAPGGEKKDRAFAFAFVGLKAEGRRIAGTSKRERGCARRANERGTNRRTGNSAPRLDADGPRHATPRHGTARHGTATATQSAVRRHATKTAAGNPPVCRMSLDVNVTPEVKCGFASPMPSRPQKPPILAKNVVKAKMGATRTSNKEIAVHNNAEQKYIYI
ncbi:hypothetical protein V9T40_010527 [Parthenolecanium corni]|uniref:Uncharacterized protein n=1 Tax=Parthenolecanium corni TaxID=536013 RepID=A0AAN9T5D4_9HEMI